MKRYIVEAGLDMRAEIRAEVDKFTHRFRKDMQRKGAVLGEEEMEGIVGDLLMDLRARLAQDPAGRHPAVVFLSNSFRAILAYRITHRLYRQDGDQSGGVCQLMAYRMSEYAAARHSIEIHPGATIGQSFVIDHGINTLIGATSVIGDHCTLLQNVVLGARKITDNEDGKRHPTIGDHVKIAGGVRIFGPVIIGDHVYIGPDCVITADVPDHVHIKLQKTVQVMEVGRVWSK